MLETNKHPGSVLHCNIVWGGRGGGGGTTDKKGVFIQIQNTIVSSKALVLVNCLNTFVHDCSFANLRPERNERIYKYFSIFMNVKRPESNGLMAPFLAIFSTLRAERCDL